MCTFIRTWVFVTYKIYGVEFIQVPAQEEISLLDARQDRYAYNRVTATASDRP